MSREEDEWSSEDDESHWVDYLEKEMDATQEKEFVSAMKKSQETEKEVGFLNETRQKIAAAGEIDLPEAEEYYQNLHSKIMQAVEKDTTSVTEELGMEAQVIPMNHHSWWTKSLVAGAVAALFVAVFSSVLLTQQGTSGADKNLASQKKSIEGEKQWLNHASSENPDAVWESLLIGKDKADLIDEEAEKKLRQMSPEEAKKAVEKILDESGL